MLKAELIEKIDEVRISLRPEQVRKRHMPKTNCWVITYPHKLYIVNIVGDFQGWTHDMNGTNDRNYSGWANEPSRIPLFLA